MSDELQVVWVVTGAPSAPYYDYLAVSAASVSHVEPDVHMRVVTDNEEAVRRVCSSLPPTNELEVVTPEVPQSPDSVLRSRFLKIWAARSASRPTLYLDCDVVCTRPFVSDMAQIRSPVAAALDRNRGDPWHNASDAWTRPLFEELGWAFPPARYCNAGVIRLAGDEKSRSFGEQWLGFWNQQVARTGEVRDQPSFNHALDVCDFEPRVLKLRFNAPVCAAPCFARDATFWHFYLGAAQENEERTLLLPRLARPKGSPTPPTPAQIGSQIAEARRRRTPSDFVLDPGAYTAGLYSSWTIGAARVRDVDAVIRLAWERIRRAPLSPRTLLMILRAFRAWTRGPVHSQREHPE